MKKHLITLLTLISFSTISFAQEKGAFEMGVNFGLNVAKVTTPDSYSYYNNDGVGYKTGVNFGISGEYYFSKKWGIKAKIVYDQKGWNNGYVTDQNQNRYITNFKLNYITIPIMANWHFGRTNNWYLNFGPYLGFLASASESTFGSDVKSNFTSTDGGLALGIGVKIPVTDNMKFFAEYQAQAGIANIFTGAAAQSNPTATNASYGLNVGLVFNLDK